MFTTRLQPGLATGKLNAEYYWPQHLADQTKLEGWDTETLEALRDASAPIAYGVLKPDDQGHECRVAKFENFDGMFVRACDCDAISEYMFNEFRRSETLEGDILIAIGGYVGRPGIVQPVTNGFRLNINRHLARFRPDRSKIDSHYVLAYLSSSTGDRQLTREITGSVQAGINLEDLRLVQVPIPTRGAQTYIGDKVRQAERLRALANIRESQFAVQILSAFPKLNETVSTDFKHGRAKSSDLNGSLNPGAFNPDRLHVRNYLETHGGRRVSDFASVETPVTSEYRPTDLYVGLDSIGSSLGRIAPSTVADEDVTGSVRILSEGPVISKLRPYLNKVAYVPSHVSPSFGSTELLCVRAKDSTLNWYLCGVLQLTSTVRQLNPISTGSTHPRVTRHDILDCFVPWIDDAASVGLLLADAQKAYFLSDKLVSAAKLLVEALIEQKLTEDELADAQTQLEHGDQTGDRAILSRLYEGGIDVTDTRPLFPDLDAYYEALHMAEQSLAEGGEE